MSERPEPKSLATESDDREDVVDLWIAAQLLIERRFYRAVGKTSGPRMRLVTLVELDALTQLSDEGETLKDIATTLGVDLTVARAAVRNLVRRSLLLRERGSDGQRLVRRAASVRHSHRAHPRAPGRAHDGCAREAQSPPPTGAARPDEVWHAEELGPHDRSGELLPARHRGRGQTTVISFPT